MWRHCGTRLARSQSDLPPRRPPAPSEWSSVPSKSRTPVKYSRGSRRQSRRANALVVLPDAMLWNERRQIVALAAKHRMPAIYPEREYVEEGGLLAYGSNVPDQWRRRATYVDKILKGAKPGDLPIQQPV